MSMMPQSPATSSSVLSSLFNRSNFSTRCKTCLNLAISRIKLLRNRREVQLINMRKEIAQYLRSGQEAVARLRVEHIIQEQNILAAYEIIELHCQFVLARIPILDAQRECPSELNEAIATILFASSKCSDLPELLHIRNLLSTKYGKEFVSAALELRPNCGVNRTVIEKLAVRAPDAESKLKILKSIALENNLEWDSSNTEVAFNTKYEDLLGGSNSSSQKAELSGSRTIVSPCEDSSSTSRHGEDGHNWKTDNSAVRETSKPCSPSSKINVANDNSKNWRSASDVATLGGRSPSDVLIKAQAAIAAANRACAAARAAASVAKAKHHVQQAGDVAGIN